MKEKWIKMQQQWNKLWKTSSKKQKAVFFLIAGMLLSMVMIISIFTSSMKLVPLYSDLSIQEVGQIKEELDARGISYELKDKGTTILVAEEQSDQLLVDLAGQGIPHSGNIDYSFFSENASWGVTDNEFNMMKLDAMQTELANLIKSIEGIEEAKVMINLPKEAVFVSDKKEQATASIVIHTSFGHEFESGQINALYHLVSKAVPELPEENIVITNQFFEYFDRTAASSNSVENEYMQQQTVKKDIEKDIQGRLQQMIGAMVGMDKVIVSVTADIDFTQENRVEEMVEPVDIDNIEGIPVSIETIQETYDGKEQNGGVAGTGEADIPNYPAANEEGAGNYHTAKDTINYELNRIHKEIAETPYKIRDLGIQVAVDNVQHISDGDVQLLSQQEQNMVEEGILSILSSIIQTSVNKEYEELGSDENVSIVFQSFHGRESNNQEQPAKIPIWLYFVVGGVVLALLIIFLIWKQKKNQLTTERKQETFIEQPKVNDISQPLKSESDIQAEQLEKMAKDNPEDFAKLLRSWISDD